MVFKSLETTVVNTDGTLGAREFFQECDAANQPTLKTIYCLLGQGRQIRTADRSESYNPSQTPGSMPIIIAEGKIGTPQCLVFAWIKVPTAAPFATAEMEKIMSMSDEGINAVTDPVVIYRAFEDADHTFAENVNYEGGTLKRFDAYGRKFLMSVRAERYDVPYVSSEDGNSGHTGEWTATCMMLLRGSRKALMAVVHSAYFARTIEAMTEQQLTVPANGLNVSNSKTGATSKQAIAYRKAVIDKDTDEMSHPDKFLYALHQAIRHDDICDKHHVSAIFHTLGMLGCMTVTTLDVARFTSPDFKLQSNWLVTMQAAASAAEQGIEVRAPNMGKYVIYGIKLNKIQGEKEAADRLNKIQGVKKTKKKKKRVAEHYMESEGEHDIEGEYDTDVDGVGNVPLLPDVSACPRLLLIKRLTPWLLFWSIQLGYGTRMILHV